MIPVPVAAPRSPTDSSAAEPTSLPTDAGPQPPVGPDLTRRGFLRGAALTGGGLMAATLAACAPSTSTPGWTFGPLGTAAPAGSPTPIPATPAPSASAGARATPAAAGIPTGW